MSDLTGNGGGDTVSDGDAVSDHSQPILPGEGASDYERYLRTDELLSLQKEPAERVHRDELLFQTVHQASELWLKLASAEVEEATVLVDGDQFAGASRLIRRAVLGLSYVTNQLDMLDQMNPWDYAHIRMALGHGAGFDSPGFRRVARVTQQISAAFDRALQRAGVDLVDLYQQNQKYYILYDLAECLTDWDQRIWMWRFRHYAVVARAIGEGSIGTQGTPVQVLGKLVAQRQLPKLWEVRSRLVELFDAERGEGSPG